MRPTSSFAIICFIIGSLLGPASYADMIKAHEPKYALAVLAYNAKKYDETLALLDALLQEAPGLIEFLELKALALKTSKNDAESAKTYQALINAKMKGNAKDSEIAPYHFELGVIQFRTKIFSDAKAHFEFSLKQNFNADTSHFFLGMIAYQESRPAEAIFHFDELVKSSIRDLRGPALFYLGQSQLKTDDSSGALSSFSEARALTEGSQDEVSKSIHTACEQVLAPLNQSRKFASLAFSLSYDSNVQALPNSLDGTLAFNKGSVKNLLQAGIGYMSSPTQTFQWVPNYRLLYNYNFNRETREGEFLSQYFTLYLNHRPLEKSTYGLKADASVTFQNQFNSGSTIASTYRVFSTTGAIGAYFRTELSRKWSTYFDASYGPQKYYGDSTLTNPSEYRTGGLLSLRATLTRASLARYLNPSLQLSFLNNASTGSEFNSKSYSTTLVNGLRFNDRLKGSINLSYTPTFYSKRPEGMRVDRNFSVGTDAQFQLNPKWTLTADASIGYNDSTVAAIYEYRRWTISSGVSYSFY